MNNTATFTGRLSKMTTEHQSPIQYRLKMNEGDVTLNELIGRRLQLRFNSEIRCCHCQRLTKKSFNQGYCYPCFQRLAQCDRCIMSPELCHYAQGTCREPEWGEQHCLRPHVVYLANSSGLKVGITRKTQIPTRWMDQGAIQALPIIEVSSRLMSGLIEDALREWVSDRSNWRKLLKHEYDEIDLIAERDKLRECSVEAIEKIAQNNLTESYVWLDEEVVSFDYPSLSWPEKAKTYNLDKTPDIDDRLIAIKGQYLIFENAALNIRKFTSYDVSLSVAD